MVFRWMILPVLLVSSAQAADFSRFVPERSKLEFVSRQMGVPVEGTFSRFDARLNFDPARPEAGKVVLSIDLASVDAGSNEANGEVVGKNWFDVKRFPQARFESTSVRSLGGGRYEARGRMEIKGRSRDVVTPFTFRPVGNQGVFEGGFVLKRLDYGIGEGAWGDPGVVADEVQIKFTVTAAATTPAKPKK